MCDSKPTHAIIRAIALKTEGESSLQMLLECTGCKSLYLRKYKLVGQEEADPNSEAIQDLLKEQV